MFAYRRKKRSNIFIAPAKISRRLQVSWRVWLGGGIILLALAGLFYLAVFSPFFKIKSWLVTSDNFTAQAQAQELVDQFFRQKLWQIIPRDSWLTFSSRRLTRLLLAEFPEAETIKISKNILKGVEVKIEGRQPAAIWCQDSAAATAAAADQATTTAEISWPSGDKCFFVDSSGWLFHEAPVISGTAWPTFFSQANEDLDLKDQALASSTIQFASQLKKQLREAEVEALGFRSGAAGSQELEVFVDGGWVVYFNMERPLSTQIKVLNALLLGDLKDKRAGLKYVDLRVAGKVYYK